MLQAILTGQAKNIVLLGIAVGLFFYFLPSVLSFLKGQKRFWSVLGLNLILTIVQGSLADTLRVGLLANFGPGWLLLLFWVLKPGETDPRLLAAQQTKIY